MRLLAQDAIRENRSAGWLVKLGFRAKAPRFGGTWSEVGIGTPLPYEPVNQELCV